MMKFFISKGTNPSLCRALTLALTLALILPGKGIAQDSSLYQQIHRITEQATIYKDGDAEEALKEFIPKVIDQSYMEIKPEYLQIAAKNLLCEQVGEKYNECDLIEKDILSQAHKQAWLRTLGRDLHLTALSYELGADGYTGRKNALASKLPSIVHVWQSGADKMTNPVVQTKMRGQVLDRDTIEDELEEIQKKLDGLGSIARIIAVWRYRHGVNTVTEEGPCKKHNGASEIQDLFRRFCEKGEELEQALTALWNKVPKEFTPPLAPKEIAVFPPESLNGGVSVWIRHDDVGLLWDTGLEPVLPALSSDVDYAECMADVGNESYCAAIRDKQVVLGGLYPDPPEEPDEGKGICSHPFAARGYLCRALELEECPSEFDERRVDDETIKLVACHPQNFKYDVRHTDSGPNACVPGGWRFAPDDSRVPNIIADTPAENAGLATGECSNCVVDLVCDSGCATPRSAKIHPKDERGRIRICIDEDTVIPKKYLLLQELVRAQQICNQPAETEVEHTTAEECCIAERDAQLVACKAMAEDGLFAEQRIDIEFCASALSNVACARFGDNACTAIPIENDEIEVVIAAAQAGAADDESCANAVSNLDTRAQALKQSLPSVCSPHCSTGYENTIGNNLCYISQCTEESFEQHRMIPGRIPFVSGDQAFPWEACAREPPKRDTLVEVPPIPTQAPPPYRVYEIIKHLDLQLCQTHGYPALTPPVLCAFDSRRPLEFQKRNPFVLAQSFTGQGGSQERSSANLEISTGNIGARLGTMLYRDYLNGALRGFNDLIGLAVTLIDQIGQTSFPQTMCPRYHTDDCSLFDPPDDPAETPEP